MLQSVWARLLVVVWAIAATGYVVVDRWSHFVADELSRATEQGRREILSRVIQESAPCRPFTVATAEDRAELIAVRCLSQAKPGVPSEQAGAR